MMFRWLFRRDKTLKDKHFRLVCKHGKDFLTNVRGTGIIDVEELRWLWQEYRRLRNDPDMDAEEDRISWCYIWIREWHWQAREMKKEDRDKIKYFVSKEKEQWEVIAIGEKAEDYRRVCDYPTWASDPNMDCSIEQAQTDEEVIAAVKKYHDDKERWKNWKPS